MPHRKVTVRADRLDRGDDEPDSPTFLRPTESSWLHQGHHGPLASNKRRSRDGDSSNSPVKEHKGHGAQHALVSRSNSSADEDEAGQPVRAVRPDFRELLLGSAATQDALAKVPLFRQCSTKFVEMLAEQVDRVVVQAGTDIMREGEYGDSMYILSRGQVEIIMNGQAVAVLSDGSVFGEMAAICRNPAVARRMATVRAKTLCDCRVAYREALLRAMALFRQDASVIEAEVTRKLEDLRQKGQLPKKLEWWKIREGRQRQEELRHQEHLHEDALVLRRSVLHNDSPRGSTMKRRKSEPHLNSQELGKLPRRSAVASLLDVPQSLKPRPSSAPRHSTISPPDHGGILIGWSQPMPSLPPKLSLKATAADAVVDLASSLCGGMDSSPRTRRRTSSGGDPDELGSSPPRGKPHAAPEPGPEIADMAAGVVADACSVRSTIWSPTNEARTVERDDFSFPSSCGVEGEELFQVKQSSPPLSAGKRALPPLVRIAETGRPRGRPPLDMAAPVSWPGTSAQSRPNTSAQSRPGTSAQAISTWSRPSTSAASPAATRPETAAVSSAGESLPSVWTPSWWEEGAASLKKVLELNPSTNKPFYLPEFPTALVPTTPETSQASTLRRPVTRSVTLSVSYQSTRPGRGPRLTPAAMAAAEAGAARVSTFPVQGRKGQSPATWMRPTTTSQTRNNIQRITQALLRAGPWPAVQRDRRS